MISGNGDSFSFTHERTNHSIFLAPTTPQEVSKTITSLKNKKSVGDDNLPIHIIKESSNYISEPLSYVINICFETGVYPELLKNAQVKAIHKKVELDKEGNCRPISLLLVMGGIGYFLHTCAIWISHNKKYSQNSTEAGSEKYEDDIRNKILTASLPYVLELGWSKECLSKGAEKIGYPGISHGMFTRGAGDLVHFFNASSNLQLVEILKQFQKEFADKPITPGQFVELAIQERLRMLVPYVHRWPQAIAIMSLPPNVPTALAALLTMVDDICYYAGDRSVDFNWYMRRLGVAGVYKATELYLIQDKSLEQVNTWRFLKRRMDEAVQLHDIISKSDITSQGAKDVAKSAFVTARNILGLSWNK